jgi:hypothetical protein
MIKSIARTEHTFPPSSHFASSYIFYSPPRRSTGHCDASVTRYYFPETLHHATDTVFTSPRMMFLLTILTTLNSDAKRMQLRGTLLPAGAHVHASHTWTLEGKARDVLDTLLLATAVELKEAASLGG